VLGDQPPGGTKKKAPPPVPNSSNYNNNNKRVVNLRCVTAKKIDFYKEQLTILGSELFVFF
jgi:hypothetical protein